jgi:hypothetical protein
MIGYLLLMLLLIRTLTGLGLLTFQKMEEQKSVTVLLRRHKAVLWGTLRELLFSWDETRRETYLLFRNYGTNKCVLTFFI